MTSSSTSRWKGWCVGRWCPTRARPSRCRSCLRGCSCPWGCGRSGGGRLRWPSGRGYAGHQSRGWRRWRDRFRAGRSGRGHCCHLERHRCVLVRRRVAHLIHRVHGFGPTTMSLRSSSGCCCWRIRCPGSSPCWRGPWPSAYSRGRCVRGASRPGPGHDQGCQRQTSRLGSDGARRTRRRRGCGRDREALHGGLHRVPPDGRTSCHPIPMGRTDRCRPGCRRAVRRDGRARGTSGRDLHLRGPSVDPRARRPGARPHDGHEPGRSRQLRQR